ncbi:MAG TPA: glycosyltransferase [Spirochaetota bacterium]|nr:glycosyltransferase [Spirochaetota bacterium]
MNLLIPIYSPPTGTYGSLTRLIAIANKFIKEGHSVAFCASGYVKNILKERDYKVYEIPETTILGLPKFISNNIVKGSQKTSLPVKEGRSFGSIWFLFVFTGYAKRKKLFEIVKSEINATFDFKADIILTEMELGAYLTAYILNKPIVTTYAKISESGKEGFFYKKIQKSTDYVVRKFLKVKNSKLDEFIFGKRVLKLIPSIPELDTTNPEREDICYTGNLLEPIKTVENKFIPENNKKYVFCYFGSGSIPFTIVKNILPQVINRMENTICYVASHFIKEEFNIGNVFFVKYIQASELLPHCKLTICHGGLNTITQSLEAGVPLIVFPGAIFERRFNAERVEALKCGFIGELSDFNAKWLYEKISAIEGLNIKAIQESFKKYKGVETAYKRIIDWIKKNS